MEILKWAAVLFGIGGLWMAVRRPVGWLLCAVASILWLIFAVWSDNLQLALTTAAWLIVESTNFFRSRKEPK